MRWQRALAVARWEYERFAKPRDLLLGILFFGGIFLVVEWIGSFGERKRNETQVVAVSGGQQLGIEGTQVHGRFELRDESARPRAELEAALAQEQVDAWLEVSLPGRAELHVRSERGWHDELVHLLQGLVQSNRLRQSALEPADMSAILAPVEVSIVAQDPSAQPGAPARTMTVLIIVGTMLLALFLGFSYVFVAITGEKTQRVTESVLAAITPQEWIDGKILGLTGVVLVNVVSYGVGYLLSRAAAVLLFGKPFALPTGVGDPWLMLGVALFSFLGFAFWFTLFAIVAATISDPNTSGRGSLMMAPFLPLAATFVGLDSPDALWMRLLALLPGMSPAAMPLRLLRGDPAFWEVALSIALLVVMILLFRRVAGKVFGISMLMTGKEPSFREVWRWSRAGV
jgi:ABC-2 type transport system permease protein